MDFHVSNLGRIPSADFDIKPLTVFIGKANTNKTWTAYALYGLLRSMSRSPRAIAFGQTAPQCDQLDRAVDTVAGRTAAKLLDLINAQSDQQSFSIEVDRAEIFQEAHPIGENLKLSLRNEDIATFLAVDPKTLGNADAALCMPTKQFIDQGKLKHLIVNWSKQYCTITGMTHGGFPIHSHFLSIPERGFALDFVKAQLVSAIRWLAMAIFDDTMAFPAERKGLLSALAFVDLMMQRGERLNLNVGSLEYIRFLFGAQRTQFRAASDVKVARLLEDDVMKGRVEFVGQTEPRVFNFIAAEGPAVNMNATASFVRSMAGFDLYLRMTPNHDVIVIDEPEMNAHPEAQLKLAELFAIMANEGRRIIVTTHSPYFIDHLNNLTQGANLPENRRLALAESLKLHDPGAFINVDNVSVYLFNENGHPQSLLLDDGVIDLESFAVESDYVGNFGQSIAQAEGEQQDGAE